jgi:hypothetical protein
VAIGEVLAGGDELALVGRPAVVVEASPGRIDLQKGVFDEVPNGNGPMMIGNRNPVSRMG